MRPSVEACYVAFTGALEGVVTWFYVDVKDLVTIAIGNLADPISTAMSLPMVRKGTSDRAAPDEIRADWQLVKEWPNAPMDGYRVLEKPTNLRLTNDGVRRVVGAKLALNDSILRQRFPDFESWPADAQLATHSMAWACGAYFHFPNLSAALLACDFIAAAAECGMSTAGNAGIVPRNAANKLLFATAASPADPDEVSWDKLTILDPRRWPAAAYAKHPDAEAETIHVSDFDIVHPPVPLPERDDPDY